MSDAMARIVIRNALFFDSGKASALTIPWATYTQPGMLELKQPNQNERNNRTLIVIIMIVYHSVAVSKYLIFIFISLSIFISIYLYLYQRLPTLDYIHKI